jgi:hypothetical protein
MALFSNDQDLVKYEPQITALLPDTQADFMPQHSASYDIIFEDLVMSKILDTRGGHEQAEAQILRPQELKQASVYKTLEIIFGFLSANGSDRFAEKSMFYRGLFEVEIKTSKGALTIDSNLNGIEDKQEVQDNHFVRLNRV